MAEMYELYAIAACVIGGASLMGGEGAVIAALAGALIMSVLQNFCNLQDIQVYWQQVLIGGLIVSLVFYDNWRKRKVKDQVKSFLAAVHGKDIKTAEAEYRKTVSVLDKVASSSTMHKNTASRQKSRLHKRLKALQGAAK